MGFFSQAGYALDATAPFWEQELDNVDSVLGVNLSGLMHLTRTHWRIPSTVSTQSHMMLIVLLHQTASSRAT